MLLEDDIIWVPKYFRSPEYVIIFKKEFFTKVFWVESFHFWKSLIWLKVEQSPSSHQKNSITKNHLTETASFTRSEKSPYHQKRCHSKSLDSSIYSEGPFVLPKLTFPRGAPSHLLLTTDLKKLYPGLRFTYFYYHLICSSSKPEPMKEEEMLVLVNISPWTAL